ncbi:MFS transporter [Chloroflexota bacterium]
MIRVRDKLTSIAVDGLDFVRSQPRDWKITAVRTSIFRFFYQMILPYLSIYVLLLGATGTQLGIVNSVGMAVAGLIAPYTGWLMDRIGVKKIYLVGIIFLVISWLVYAIAWNWTFIIVAMLAYWLGFRTSMHGCTVICGNSLATQDRATAMSCCETLAAGLLGVAGPMIGALVVSSFGGVNINGIRPLFYISLAGTVATFILVYTQISNKRWGGNRESRVNFLSDFVRLMKQGRNLKRFIIISTLTFLPTGMIIPFTQPFAYEIKGANEFVLGAMVTGFALTPLLLGIPIGRLADRIGRKKVIYLITPLFWISNLMLIWAPNSFFLIFAGILQGFFFVLAVVTAAMQFEMVPPEHMGKWMGILGFFRMLVAAITAYFAGIIWDNLGPQYVFLLYLSLDITIRIPLLITIPETLGIIKTE